MIICNMQYDNIGNKISKYQSISIQFAQMLKQNNTDISNKHILTQLKQQKQQILPMIMGDDAIAMLQSYSNLCWLTHYCSNAHSLKDLAHYMLHIKRVRQLIAHNMGMHCQNNSSWAMPELLHYIKAQQYYYQHSDDIDDNDIDRQMCIQWLPILNAVMDLSDQPARVAWVRQLVHDIYHTIKTASSNAHNWDNYYTTQSSSNDSITNRDATIQMNPFSYAIKSTPITYSRQVEHKGYITQSTFRQLKQYVQSSAADLKPKNKEPEEQLKQIKMIMLPIFLITQPHQPQQQQQQQQQEEEHEDMHGQGKYYRLNITIIIEQSQSIAPMQSSAYQQDYACITIGHIQHIIFNPMAAFTLVSMQEQHSKVKLVLMYEGNKYVQQCGRYPWATSYAYISNMVQTQGDAYRLTAQYAYMADRYKHLNKAEQYYNNMLSSIQKRSNNMDMNKNSNNTQWNELQIQYYIKLIHAATVAHNVDAMRKYTQQVEKRASNCDIANPQHGLVMGTAYTLLQQLGNAHEWLLRAEAHILAASMQLMHNYNIGNMGMTAHKIAFQLNTLTHVEILIAISIVQLKLHMHTHIPGRLQAISKMLIGKEHLQIHRIQLQYLLVSAWYRQSMGHIAQANYQYSMLIGMYGRYKFSLQAQGRSADHIVDICITAINRQAMLCLSNKKQSNAANLYNQATSMAVKAYGQQSTQAAIQNCLHGQALIFQVGNENNAHTPGWKQIEKSIPIIDKNSENPIHRQQIIQVYQRCGHIYMANHKYQQALHAYTKLMEVLNMTPHCQATQIKECSQKISSLKQKLHWQSQS